MLFDVEQVFYRLFSGTPISIPRTQTVTEITSPINSSPQILTLFIVLLLVGCIAKVFWEDI
jgi:hypothetical protein